MKLHQYLYYPFCIQFFPSSQGNFNTCQAQDSQGNFNMCLDSQGKWLCNLSGNPVLVYVFEIHKENIIFMNLKNCLNLVVFCI